MGHVSFFKNNYPRPQHVRKQFVLLDGKWDFCFDDANEGLNEKWYLNHIKKEYKINVPFAYQTPLSGINKQEHHDIVWYENSVVIKTEKDKNTLINFDAVDFECDLWVNGCYVGHHKGGYTRFSFNISPFLNGKEEKITLRVKDTLSPCQARGKQIDVNNTTGCWYDETTGIWKSVWLENVSKTYIERIKITPNLEESCFDMIAYINGPIDDDVFLTSEETFNGRLIDLQINKINDTENQFRISAKDKNDLFRVNYWTPENPLLYEFNFILKKGNKILDEVKSYAGYRNFHAKKDILYLNQNPVYLRLVLNQGYWKESGLTAPSFEKIESDLKLIKDLGFNGFRAHQKIEDDRTLYLADANGLLVWCEMPSSYFFSDTTIENITNEWIGVIKQTYNHPSIIVWVPVNESWGVPLIRTDKLQQNFANSLYYLTKSMDKNRPVIANDGWEHTVSDIITLHNYEQVPEKLKEFYSDLDRVLDNKNYSDYSQTRNFFADGYSYQGQPIMLDEFCGIGFKNNQQKGWGYGHKVHSKEEFAERLSGLIKVTVENRRFAGFCVTQLTDVYEEINGLVDFDRKEKISTIDLKRAIEQK